MSDPPLRTMLQRPRLQDAVVFAAVALFILPLAPDQFMGPFHALNPRKLVLLVLVVMAIGAAGHLGTRWLGPRYGLPLAGFAAGFVSSTATIHSMGQRARANPPAMAPAVAGAALSSMATIAQMALLMGLVQPSLLRTLALPLLLGGLAATLYGLYFLYRAHADRIAAQQAQQDEGGRLFDLRASLSFALLLGLVMTLSAALNAWLGEQGLLLGALVAGLADAHAAAASTATLMAAGTIQVQQAVLPVLLGLSANTLTKAVVAINAGGAAYARKIIPGLLLMALAVWLGYALLLAK